MQLDARVAHALLGATEASASLKNVRATWPLPPSSCPNHVGQRPEAPWHATAEAFSACVPPAAVCLLVDAHVAQDRVPSPEASIGTSPAHLGGYLGSDGRIGGGEAWRFEGSDALCLPRLALWRRFSVCLEDARGIAQRRPSAVSGLWRSHLCVYCRA